ncbi:MAG TPA: hypothetical protein VFN89_01420, partial [Solirubrobacterales bacterium]|nr:hypothetical protein [Solirubrobacterales bacterium]
MNRRIDEFSPGGEFIVAWGWDVVASGPDDTASGEFEVCFPESGDECKAGVQGISGVGQFDTPIGVAVDSAGNVYIADPRANRVQKFNSKGEFELMFGGQVNKTKVALREAEEAASEPVTVTEEEENLCPFDPGDECGAGVAGTGLGQFHWSESFFGDYIAAGPADKIYVGDQERIERFDATGAFQDECSVPGRVQSLDTDSAGDLYAVYAFQPNVRKLTYVAGGECEEVGRFEIPEPDEVTHPVPTATTVDAAGDVYAFSWPASRNGFVPIDRIYEFDPTGNLIDQFGKEEFGEAFEGTLGMATSACAPGNLFVTNGENEASAKGSFLRAYGSEPTGCFKALTLPASEVEETGATLNGTVDPEGEATSECRFEWGTTTAYGHEASCAESPGAIGDGSEPVHVHAIISNLSAATIYHFRLRARIKGETETGPDRAFKTKGPPTISDEHVVSATSGEVTVKALVDPEGFPTSCHVDYGSTESYGQSSADVAVGSDRSEHAVTVLLSGLTPGAVYHWRFACHNTAVLNGGRTEGEDHILTTFRSPGGTPSCPNDALRAGASASLPDCRAYEMVSPVDKNGADIVSGYPTVGSYGGYVQVAPDGEKITYAAKFPAFAGPSNSFTFNQYLASRGGEGSWSTESLVQPYDGHAIENAENHVFVGSHREFMAFTPDLCSAWLLDLQTPPLEPDGQENAANLYRRENCSAGAGSFETLTTSLLGLGESDSRRLGYVDQFSVEGVADDGSQAIFRAKAQLIKEAAVGGEAQLYDRSAAGLHLVSVLSGGAADASAAAVGSGWGQNFPSNLKGAVSADGSLVYWTGSIKDSGEGKLYLRRHPDQGSVKKECDEAGTRACTIPVSEGSQAFFWQGSADGSKAIYSEGEELFEFDLASESSHLVAKGLVG